MDSLVLLAQVVVVTLALSGDNALALALTVRRLPPAARPRAVMLGHGAAIVVCIVLAGVATLLLRLPGLRLIGGSVLVGIGALQLRQPGSADPAARRAVGHHGAILTIFLAELGVSLDNVLGASAAAGGNLLVLRLGLSAGMALVILGGVQLARLLSRSAWLVVLAAGIVAWAGARLAVDDPLVLARGAPPQSLVWLVPAAIVATGVVRWWSSGRGVRSRQRAAAAAGDASERRSS